MREARRSCWRISGTTRFLECHRWPRFWMWATRCWRRRMTTMAEKSGGEWKEGGKRRWPWCVRVAQGLRVGDDNVDEGFLRDPFAP